MAHLCGFALVLGWEQRGQDLASSSQDSEALLCFRETANQTRLSLQFGHRMDSEETRSVTSPTTVPTNKRECCGKARARSIERLNQMSDADAMTNAKAT
jgi:hypothetical protein